MNLPHATPVVLFVHARPSHASETLEGLRRNAPALLYIFSDAARAPDQVSAVAQVREIVRSVNWTETRVIERQENLGLAQSIINGLDEVFESHDRAIVLEDDCVPGPGFLNFMEAALNRYADSDSVASVSGYGIPIKTPSVYPFDGYFAHRISSWGWATWRTAWRRAMRRDLPEAADEARRKGIDLAIGGRDFETHVRRQLDSSRRRDIWTPLWGLGTLIEGMRTLWATRSFIRNIGLDGSGENSGIDPRFEPLVAERTTQFRFPPANALDPALNWRFVRFYDAQNPSRGTITSRTKGQWAGAGPGRSSQRDHEAWERLNRWIEDLLPGKGLLDRPLLGRRVLDTELAVALDLNPVTPPDEARMAQWSEVLNEAGTLVFVAPCGVNSPSAGVEDEFDWNVIETRLRGHGLITMAILPLEDGADLGIPPELTLEGAAPASRWESLLGRLRRGASSILVGSLRPTTRAAQRRCLFLAIRAGQEERP